MGDEGMGGMGMRGWGDAKRPREDISQRPFALTHSRTHALTHSRTHALTHSRTHALTHSRTHALTHSRTHAPLLALCPRASEHPSPSLTVLPKVGVTRGRLERPALMHCGAHRSVARASLAGLFLASSLAPLAQRAARDHRAIADVRVAPVGSPDTLRQPPVLTNLSRHRG